jgi:hypothetical protein
MTMTSSLVEEINAVVAAVLGGARYGVKIRLPHALLMTLLFRQNQSASKKVATILKLTRDHAVNLATFAAIYKVHFTAGFISIQIRTILTLPCTLHHRRCFFFSKLVPEPWTYLKQPKGRESSTR